MAGHFSSPTWKKMGPAKINTIIMSYPAAEHILALSEQKLTEQGSRQLALVSGIPEAGSGTVELLQLAGFVPGEDAVVTGVLASLVVGDCVASVVVANPSIAGDAAAIV
jgi:hypothetical protein